MTALTQGISRLDGKYRVIAQLGQGGSADVSLAVSHGPSGFNKLVVLKSMKASLREEHELARMFLNEARLAARLNHPNIVQTNEVFEFDGLPVIVMEYLEGQPLTRVLARSRGTDKFPLAMQLRVISEALSGLHYAHELQDFDGSPLGVVHRDMSPQNVFITFDGQVKILDFGIAKLAASKHHTATGVIKGKLHYMPPEQITGEGVDRRTDLYAVGVMLWEAAAGRRMWLEAHDAKVMNHIINDEVPRLRDVAPNVDDELARIVDKALAYQPAARHATALELQAELDTYMTRACEPVSLRDVGKVASELFEDTRARTQRLIESQLARVPLSVADYGGAPVELSAATHSGFTAGSRSETPLAAPPRAANRSTLLVAAGAALGTVLVGAWLLRPEPRAAVAAPSPSAQQAPATAKLRITAFPAQARVFVDEQLMPSNPYSREFPGQGQKLSIRAEAAGYRVERRELVLDRDVELVLVLEPLPAATAPATAAPAPVEAAPASQRPRSGGVRKSEKAVASDDCLPPYTIDADGVKKFKTHCL